MNETSDNVCLFGNQGFKDERELKTEIFFRFLRPMSQYVHEQRLYKLID